jgi:hypothetical protein
MGKVYIFLIYLLVIVCGGCAVSELLFGKGSGLGLLSVSIGLLIILYIVRLPVEKERKL